MFNDIQIIMNRYTIYCTEAQTKKALELGAPLFRYTSIPNFAEVIEISISEYYEIPTAEELIGWLEDNNIETIIVCKKDGGDYGYTVYHTSHRSPLQHFWFSSRKEATLAAIDAALEYLSNKK